MPLTPCPLGGDRRPATGSRQLRIGADIALRLRAFGVAALELARLLPRDFRGRHVGIQWIRAATGAGANYEEARAAESRADFIHKAGIAAKEMREANYWIDLIRSAGLVKADVSRLAEEARELAAILGASVRTARSRID
jgi:four helix bundle protein